MADLFYKFVFPSLMNTTDEILLAQVDEWHAPAAPRRRVDRGYIPPSPNHLSSSWSHPNLQTEELTSPGPPIHQFSNLEDFMQRAPAPELNRAPASTLVPAEVELRRLCISEGWGVPSVHLTGQRVSSSGFQVHILRQHVTDEYLIVSLSDTDRLSFKLQ